MEVITGCLPMGPLRLSRDIVLRSWSEKCGGPSRASPEEDRRLEVPHRADMESCIYGK